MTPRLVPVGLPYPQQQIKAWLGGADEPLDVTRNNVIVALRPLTIGLTLPNSCSQPLDGRTVYLFFSEMGSPDRLLGTIHLRLVRSIPLPQHRFCLFETCGCRTYCRPAATPAISHLRRLFRAKPARQENPHNFEMTQSELECMFTFYLCPRPVMMVSVEHEAFGNMFPMDLIGPTDSPWFSLALRNSSPAVPLIQQSRRLTA